MSRFFFSCKEYLFVYKIASLISNLNFLSHMWKRCQIYTHSFGVVKFCSLRGEGRLKNGVRMKSYDYIRFDWIWFLLTHNILVNVIYNYFANSTTPIRKWSKEVKSDNFCYCKVRRAINKRGTIKKGLILLSQYWKKKSHGCTNQIQKMKQRS